MQTFVEDVWGVIDNLTLTHLYECPTGWTDSGSPDIGCFFFGTTNKKWTDALTYCESLLPPNSGLAEIYNKQTQDFLVTILNQKGSHHWWIGASASFGSVSTKSPAGMKGF